MNINFITQRLRPCPRPSQRQLAVAPGLVRRDESRRSRRLTGRLIGPTGAMPCVAQTSGKKARPIWRPCRQRFSRIDIHTQDLLGRTLTTGYAGSPSPDWQISGHAGWGGSRLSDRWTGRWQ